MSISEEKIKAAILHPDPIVREAALQYFTLSYSRDPGVMPIAVQAIEKYGWDEAFLHFWRIQNLPQTDEMLLWLVSQLDGPHSKSASTTRRIWPIICEMDAEVLGRHESLLSACKWLPGRSRDIVGEKIRLLSVPTDVCWKELENLCQRHKDDTDIRQFEFGRANRLVEAVSRDGNRHADKVLSVLSPKIEKVSRKPWVRLEGYAATLAGLIRLEASVPLLVARLRDDGADYMDEECEQSLTQIGGAAAIAAIARDFHSTSLHYRMCAFSALRGMRGENVVAQALELLKGNEDRHIRATLIGALLANFDTRGLVAAREFSIDELVAEGFPDLRCELIATAVLTGESFPQMERLREKEREESAEIRRHREAIFDEAPITAKPNVEELFDEPVVQPARPNVGHNDPCPCGSGWMYKNCCLGRVPFNPSNN